MIAHCVTIATLKPLLATSPKLSKLLGICNLHPLNPYFYIVKLGFIGLYIIFLFLL